jgi:hypothetical protein
LGLSLEPGLDANRLVVFRAAPLSSDLKIGLLGWIGNRQLLLFYPEEQPEVYKAVTLYPPR